MRWIGVLVLAGCSTWTTYDEGPEQRPHVVEALRAMPAAPVAMVHGERGYWTRRGVLESEVKAFTNALADALEGATPARPPRGGTTDRDVLAFVHPTRSLSTDALEAEAYRYPDGLWYKVTVRVNENRYRVTVCRATPDIERTWEALARAARDRAGDSVVASIGPHTPLRDIGIDFKGMP